MCSIKGLQNKPMTAPQCDLHTTHYHPHHITRVQNSYGAIILGLTGSGLIVRNNSFYRDDVYIYDDLPPMIRA